jgi:hypothetical protein
LTTVSSETFISIAATLIVCESLERNVHFFNDNVHCLRKSRTKRPFLARQRSFFMKVSNETLISIAATLIFCESLERNVHFFDSNVQFLRESRTKRTFLARQRSFFTRVSNETLISMHQNPNFATVPQIQRGASQLTRSRAAGLGLIDFRALLQLAPAGASVASAGAELCPRDKLFGFVAAVARSGPLLTSGRLGPRMQSF